MAFSLTQSGISEEMEKVKIVEGFKEEAVNETSDLVVLCGEDTYHLNSGKLSGKSMFFRMALDTPMLEKKERKIEIKVVDDQIFKKVIKFIYDDKLELELDGKTELSKMFDAADRFDIESLKTELGNQIEKHLDKENIIDIAHMAQIYHAKKLLNICIEFIIMEDIKIEMRDVAGNPGLAVAVMEQLKTNMAIMRDKLKKNEETLKTNEEECESLKTRILFYEDGEFDDNYDYEYGVRPREFLEEHGGYDGCGSD